MDRKAKTQELLKHHKHTFDKIKEKKPYFVAKCAYKPKGKDELFLGFFDSELKSGQNIFVEFTSSSLEPEDPNRTLYKWVHNPHYKEEYEMIEGATAGSERYLIPASELIVINKVDKETIKRDSTKTFPDFELDPNTDAPLQSMTIRDFVAIMHKKPVSHKDWLNTLIKMK
jgi:hypothetical protein